MPIHLARTPGVRKTLLQVVYYLFLGEAPVAQTLWAVKQLPVLDLPWNSISMDFIEKLPSSSGYMSILVIVDQLSKQSLFIPMHDIITSSNLMQLFVLHIFSKHGVPLHITSNHGSEFV